VTRNHAVFESYLWYAVLAGLLLCVVACGRTHRSHVDTYPVAASGRSAEGFGRASVLEFETERVVDTSLVSDENGRVRIFSDFDDGRSFASSHLTASGRAENFTPIEINRNFTYVLRTGGTYFRFGMYLWDIFLETSADGLVWTQANGGAPVLRHDTNPDSAWHRLWNVAVDVGPDGTWHLLAECSDATPNQRAVGLCYATGAGPESFVRDSGAQLIPDAGNPYLKVMPDGGLLIVHGVLNSAYGPYSEDYWYVSASTCTAGVCTTHRDRFTLGTPGIHDADPHLAETPDGLILVLSVDQSHCVRLTAESLTLSGLYNSLTESL